MTKKEKVIKAVEALETLYPDAICSLNYSDAFQLLIATRLSAHMHNITVIAAAITKSNIYEYFIAFFIR